MIETYTKITVTRIDFDGIGGTEPAVSPSPAAVAKQVLQSEFGKYAKGFRVDTTECIFHKDREFSATPTSKIFYFGRPATADDIAKLDAPTREFIQMTAKTSPNMMFWVDRNDKVREGYRGDTLVSAETLAMAVLDTPASELLKV